MSTEPEGSDVSASGAIQIAFGPKEFTILFSVDTWLVCAIEGHFDFSGWPIFYQDITWLPIWDISEEFSYLEISMNNIVGVQKKHWFTYGFIYVYN